MNVFLKSAAGVEAVQTRKPGQHDRKRRLERVAVVMCLWAAALGAKAQTNYQRLMSFGSPQTAGAQLNSPIIEGGDGALYGMTAAGGANFAGTIFKLNRDGSGYTVILNFTNGPFPYGGLLQGADGLLYGTRTAGGSNNLGVIFKVDTSGNGYSELYSFTGVTNGGDGAVPVAGLIQDRLGVLYGTTEMGGTSNVGTVFCVHTNGSGYRVLHSFGGTNQNWDGSNPFGGLVQGADGLLYGTTQSGGSNNLGTVFELDTNGGGYHVVHDFAGADGATPFAALVQGSDGAFYGTTEARGSHQAGTVFRLDAASATYTVLHEFGGAGDGSGPWSRLVQSGTGALYGATRLGGDSGAGTVFTVNTNGANYAILHSFAGAGFSGDGTQPETPLLLGGDGALYGATCFGGDAGDGTVFRLFAFAPRVRITAIKRYGAANLLTFSDGAAGQLYQIQATTNLAQPNGWQTLGSTNAAIDGTFEYTDTNAANFRSRFYRSAAP